MTRILKQEALLIRGLPGSGKSTLARQYAAQGYVHVEADDYFLVNGVYIYDPTKVRDAHLDCQQRMATALAQGSNVVVANTFTRLNELLAYRSVAETFGASVRILVARGNYANVHGVPEEFIQRMRERWEE